eukprot:GHUV01021969.1.p1 GENE.GHUV01021969.1~~GHUV01021969.1.p1  ORF type:complete len:229 (+),score=25.60 GHUV01021969.1:224-910(+)
MTRHRNHHRLHLSVWLAWLLLNLLGSSRASGGASCSVNGQCSAPVDAHEPTQVGEAVAPTTADASATDTTASDEAAAHEAPADAPEHLSTSKFPSGNKAVAATGKRFQELLSGLSGHSGVNSSLVTLFYLADGCPHSQALKPVFECLTAFFPQEIRFVSVSHHEMSLVSLMTHGIHALPVIQVNAHVSTVTSQVSGHTQRDDGGNPSRLADCSYCLRSTHPCLVIPTS